MRRALLVLATGLGLGALAQPAQRGGPLNAVYEQARPAAVRVENGRGVGTGFFISPDGLVMTAYHVVQGGERLRVVLSDRSALSARLVGFDEYRDLAVIRVQSSRRDFPSLSLAGAAPRRGEALVAIGNSRGAFLAARGGNLRALGQRLGGGFPEGLVSMSLRLAPGDSGGPVLNAAGRVVGVSVAVGQNERGFASFASPLYAAGRLVSDLSAGSRRSAPFLGVALVELTPQAVRELGYGRPGGLLVQQVIPGTGAARAGVRDPRVERAGREVRLLEADILVAVDGRRFDSRGALVEYLRGRNVGDTVELSVRRGNGQFTLRATLGTRP